MTRAWKIMAAAGMLLAGVAIFLSVLLYVTIQEDREASIRRSCVESNERYDDTLARVDKLIAEMPDGARKRRAEANRASTLFFIEGLVPKRDCERVVDRQLHPR